MFHLEPCDEQIEMPAGVTFTVTAEAEPQGSFEVEHGGDESMLRAWPSAVVKVFREGDDVGGGPGAERPAVPPIPAGQSVSE